MNLIPLLESLAADIRYALRGFHRNLGFTLTALLAIAIGIASATSVFSVVDRILFRPLPYAAGEGLVTFGLLAPIEQREFMLGSDYVVWRRQQTPFSSVTSFAGRGVTDCDITSLPPVRQRCAEVESNFLPTLGVSPPPGRNFSAEEDRPNSPGVAMISHGLWKSRFGSDPAIIGKTFSLDSELTTIIGVLPSSFEFPTLAPVDILRPQRLDEARQQRPNTGTVLRAYARLKPGVTVQQAAAALQPLFQDSLRYVPPAFRNDVKLSIRSLRDLQTENVRASSWVLLGAVFAVLLISCANVANLLLARSVARRREFAVRAALGAGRGRLVRQALTESLLLGFAGGAAGYALAFWLLKVFIAIAPPDIPYLQAATLDGRVLLFALLATAASTILFGLVPALRNPRAESLAGWHAAGGGRSFLRQSLAAIQVAASLILLTAASLLLQSFRNMEATPLGMQTESVLTANVVLGAANYARPEQQQAFFERIERRIALIPGVAAFGISDSLPPNGATHTSPFYGLEVEGEAPPQHDQAGGMAAWRLVSPGYFSALQIPLLEGRPFQEADRDSKENVIILSSTLARRLLPYQNPVGKHVAVYHGSAWFTVVGVAANVKNGGIAAPDDPEFYLVRKHNVDFASNDPHSLVGPASSVIIRSSQNPKATADWIRAEFASVDSTLPVKIETMTQRVSQLTAKPRFNAALLGLFAAAGLLLAAIGLYGVISFLVAQSTQEIGVRMALGATPGRIAIMVLARAARWAAAGIVLGLIGSYFVSSAISALLFEVKPTDPAILAGVTIFLLLIALAAAWIPATRAMRVDPMMALRHD